MVGVEQHAPPMARPRVAAGALFLDEQDRVLMVRPTYKGYWDIPGGYVEPGESPRDACKRELLEELGISLAVGRLVAVDWAPHPAEGDKLLFIFAGDRVTREDIERFVLQPDEIAEIQFVPLPDIRNFTIDRLAKRITSAAASIGGSDAIYLEHGDAPGSASPCPPGGNR
jgi:ADP-ribose pyrophosphatase YjhB (NUDIX family)